MRPEDVDTLRELRRAAYLATKQVEQFAAEASRPLEETEQLDLQTRFDTLWDDLERYITEGGLRRGATGSTFTPIVTENAESYRLQFYTSNYAGWRGIQARWTYDIVEDGTIVDEYRFEERFSEEWISLYPQLDEDKRANLANLETSFQAFATAVGPLTDEYIEEARQRLAALGIER